MTQPMECPEARVSLGVYVLGAIDPGERALVDSHLATCRECRDELAGLAGLPALLSRVSAEEAAALAVGPDETAGADDAPVRAAQAVKTARIDEKAPPELVATVLDLTAARRRRRRLTQLGAGVAAALIVAAATFGGLQASGGTAPSTSASGENFTGTPNGPWRTFTTAAGGMSATVSYRSMGWGTQLQVKTDGIPLGTLCQLLVLGPAGSRTLAGSWVTDNHEGTVWYPASAGVSASGIRGFEVTVGSGKPLTLTT